jgi:hypothetical protein
MLGSSDGALGGSDSRRPVRCQLWSEWYIGLVWCNAQTGKLAEVPGCAVRRLVSRHVAVWARQSGVNSAGVEGWMFAGVWYGECMYNESSTAKKEGIVQGTEYRKAVSRARKRECPPSEGARTCR